MSTLAAANPLRAYAAVTAAYWAFMLSDGALRMLVLLHFYRLGYSPFTLAFLFLLYEQIMGRPVSVAFQNAAALIGLVLIVGMFLVVTFNDISNLFGL